MMKTYRIYPLNSDGKIAGPATDIAYQDDLEVLEAARGMFELMEIWQNTRLVHRLNIGPSATPPVTSVSAVRYAA